MRSQLMCGLLLLGVMGATAVEAAGPGGNTAIRNRRWCTKTVTTTTLTSPQLINTIQIDDPTTGQPVVITVTFTATYQTVTETTRILCWTRTKTSSSLTFSGTGLPDGTSVTFNVNDAQNSNNPLIPGGGTATFSSNVVSLLLATVNGNVVPTVTEGDLPTVEIDVAGQTFGPFDINPFGAPQTTVTTTTCGR